MFSTYTDDYNIDFVYTNNIDELAEYCRFFLTPTSEFKLFYNKMMLPEPKSIFIKYYRFKSLLINNDCQDFIQTMTKKGQSIKYRIFFLKTLKSFYYFQLSKKILKWSIVGLLPLNWIKVWNYSFTLLFKITFYFKFNFHKIDKRVKKFTRKKKLNYKIVYNYIPQFKRRKWLIKMFINQLDVMPQRTYRDKLFNLLCWFIKKPKTTYLYRLKFFTYSSILKLSYQSTFLKSH